MGKSGIKHFFVRASATKSLGKNNINNNFKVLTPSESIQRAVIHHRIG